MTDPSESSQGHSADYDATTEALIERLNNAFVAANRAEFMDTDFDLPILEALTAMVSDAWHQGYGAGSSNVTDGWMRPGSPRTTNPYTRVTTPVRPAQ